ncbi:hypothetical protein MAJ_09910, partial [Metarhizium majus ARSEF 297]
MKRCANLMPPPSERPTKSQRKSSSHRINVVKETKNVNIEETESARQQALPYLLATARIPIRVLTAEWKIGQNRSLDFDHVQDLCSAFRNKALKRTAYDNYLFVSGRRESVHKMKEHLQGAGRTGEEPLPFDDWADVNPEERLEIIAGQHRRAALEELGQQDGFHEEALWWTCEIYDQDAMPYWLLARLRANRIGLSLPDSHGQIWTQLVLATQQDRDLLSGKKVNDEDIVLDILQLRDIPRFPISRLLTLWDNDRWRPMITRWCETAVGRDLFNISTWEWMASCRIDNYWFHTFNRVLKTLSALPGNHHVNNIREADWNKLTKLLPDNRDEDVPTDETIRRFFYMYKEKNPRVDSSQPIVTTHRQKGVLEAVPDQGYRDIYRFLVENKSEVSFTDVGKLLKTGKSDGRTMTRVMEHVMLWLNRCPTALYSRNKKNKPLLREDLATALEGMSAAAGGDTGTADRRSILLERKVLEYTRNKMSELLQPGAREYLDILPEIIQTDDEPEETIGESSTKKTPAETAATSHAAYAERFVWEFWIGLLKVVSDFAGPGFRPWWRVNASKPRQGAKETTPSALTRYFCGYIGKVPEVVGNPALNSKEAAAELAEAIDEQVTAWAAKRCKMALSNHPAFTGNTATWTDETKQLVELAAENYNRRVDLLTRLPSRDLTPVASPILSQDSNPTQPWPLSPLLFVTSSPTSERAQPGQGTPSGRVPLPSASKLARGSEKTAKTGCDIQPQITDAAVAGGRCETSSAQFCSNQSAAKPTSPAWTQRVAAQSSNRR